ncbi:PREDICTED: uncharacterized protein LOC109586865 [Amphimedon queenslandica]|uniref:Ig-like domain-containing protein n=1 Tax=Amphimedon queenslandica TaxID=400682 RepID=A0AAN0JNP0_AMPQE|nr:PREDICTED: uncharacterized protein LOC109586865 [Amphimedon queenslandica]|eukprot:XP_019858652.1 PREDICTED: uncharacterized protein LOC109586865 [Amphimedon queenslandica]
MPQDNIVELQEVFRWRLTVNDSRVRLDPEKITQLVRLDNQDVFNIGFKDVNVTIREGEGAALTIKQIGNETGGADIGGFPEDGLQPIQLELILGTATNGSDFLINFTVPRLTYSVNNTLNDISFTSITSIDDNIIEGNETLKVVIVPVGNNVQAQKDRQTATITIIDNNIITTPPESVTVLLNEGGRANFTCEGTGGVLRWTVEGLPTDHSLNQERSLIVSNTSASPDVLSSVLSVAVLPINDGVNITCQIYSISNPFDPTTSTSTLTIRGISSVEDLQWSNDDQLLSWSPPSFYSNDILPGGIATYNVLVNGISVTNTANTSVWLNSTALNISCKEFDVSVTVFIVQYVSLGTVHSFNNTANYTVFYESLLMNYDESNSTFSANLTSLINSTQSCDSTIMGRVYPDKGIKENTQFIKANEKEEIFQYKMIGLKPCRTYTAVIDVLHYFIRGDKTNFTFTTPSSDVYDIIVSNENESVSVECVYALLSTAEGCHVVFNDVANKRSESFNITGSGNTTISLSTSGHYTVTAYDILNESIIPWSCVQPKLVTVVKFMPSPSSVRSSNELLHTLYSEDVPVLTSSESPSSSDLNISPAIPSTINSNSINSVVLIGSSAVGAVIVFAPITIIIAVAAVVWHIRKTKTKSNFMSNNPAYGQIQLTLQMPSEIKTDVNPAYETVTNNALYETVF